MKGKLTLAATPIGNLGDVSLRLLDALRNASVILAEDTRNTRKLLSRYEINNRLASFHEHSGADRYQQVRHWLTDGQHVVYVSDAGMPGIADPGYELVQLAIETECELDVLPGPSAPITALLLSGLPPCPHAFLGFVPRTRAGREQLLARMQQLNMTAILFESPHRLTQTLRFFAQMCPEAQVVICRELTKLHQEILRGSAREQVSADRNWRGELVLVVGALTQPVSTSLQDRYRTYRDEGQSHLRAVKQLAQDLSISKRAVAQRLQSESEGGPNDQVDDG